MQCVTAWSLASRCTSLALADTRGSLGSYLLRALTDFKGLVEFDSGTAHKIEFVDRAATHGFGRRQCHRHLFGAARDDRAPGRELEEPLSIGAC